MTRPDQTDTGKNPPDSKVDDHKTPDLKPPGQKRIERKKTGRKKKPRTGARAPASLVPERKCIVSGLPAPRDRLIRCVVGPDDEIVPDLSEKLPGRGLWVTADRSTIEKAVAKGLFARAARARVKASPDLAIRIEELLVVRVIHQIGLVRKAGSALNGYEKVVDCIEKGRASVLLEAADGAADGRNKLVRQVKKRNEGHKQLIHVVGLLNSAELSLAFGHQHVIHAALKSAPVTKMALRDLERLAGFRPMVPPSWNMPDDSLTDDRVVGSEENDGRKARSAGERNE